MHWRCVLERDGEIIQQKEGEMPDPVPPFDPYVYMSQPGYPGERAKVSCTVQHSIAYGEVKCSFTLTVSCPQTKQMVDYTSKEIFSQATNYVNSAMQWLAPGLEPLQVPPQ